MMDVKKVAEKWEIWSEGKEAARLKEEVKKLVLKRFHRQIKIFGKKQSERVLMRKVQNHVIYFKEEFVLRKEKIYLLSRREREEEREFIQEQVKKEYI